MDEARDAISTNGQIRQWMIDAKAGRERWRKRIAELKAALADAENQERTLDSQILDRQEEHDRLVDPDVGAIRVRMETIEHDNALVRAKLERDKLASEVKQLQERARKITRGLEEIDVAKETALANATMPVAGLAFGEAGVTLGGVPFSQASSAQQLRASVAMGLAQNPRLRVMLVREGSLLDSASMADLEKIATEYDAQVWVEQVTDGQKVGIVIEDGEVAQ